MRKFLFSSTYKSQMWNKSLGHYSLPHKTEKLTSLCRIPYKTINVCKSSTVEIIILEHNKIIKTLKLLHTDIQGPYETTKKITVLSYTR